MKLPFRIESEPGERVLSVDGAYGAPGLNLSHWPGNTTPVDLKHDLSTGVALNFARLAPDERAARAAGCVALTNNHFDTDGACALFAVLEPELALAHAAKLLDAAAAGDFFRVPTEEAFVWDVLLTRIGDRESSPHAAEYVNLDDTERYARATAHALARIPLLLAEGIEPAIDEWREPLAALRRDTKDLDAAARDDLVHLDFSLWVAPANSHSARPGAAACFDPGRHALFGAGDADRVLALGPGDAGTTARFILGTTSWFDLVSRSTQPRPDLAALAEALNGAEGCGGHDDICWRHQSPSGASPELWFGASGLPNYCEHAGDFLARSALDPLRIKGLVLDALRAVFVFPDEEDD